MVKKVERIEMLSVARSILCDRVCFYRSRLHFHCGLTDFSENWGYWRCEASDEERAVLCRFMDGEPIRRDSNWVEFIVPESRLDGMVMTDEELMDALFFDNPHFMFADALHGRKIDVQLVPGTARCLRRFKGCNRELGPYRKFKLGFSITVRLESALADISEEELADHFWCRNDFSPESRDECWRMIKAVAADPNGVYCGRSGRFLAKAPQGSKDLDRIFMSEMKASRCTRLMELIKLGADFAPSAEIRKDLVEGLWEFRLGERGNVCHFSSYHGNPQMKGWCSVGLKLPRTDVRPWLFVSNVCKGAEECLEHVREWVADGYVRGFECKVGGFEACVKLNEFPNIRAASYLMGHRRATGSMVYTGRLQISVEDLLDEVTREMCSLVRYVSAVGRYVECLLGGSRGVEVLWANLCQSMLYAIKMSPADFVEHPNCNVKCLANYYLNGEM